MLGVAVAAVAVLCLPIKQPGKRAGKRGDGSAGGLDYVTAEDFLLGGYCNPSLGSDH